MSTVSLSFASPSVQPPRAVAEAPRPPRRTGAEPAEPAERSRGRDGGAGRLEQAITAALQTLGVGQVATAPAPAPAPAPAAAAAAGPADDSTDVAAPVTLQSAVDGFAQALYAALRDVGGGRGPGPGQGHGHGHAYGHHDDHGWRGRGYGSLSNRLENLAATLGTTAPAAPATLPVSEPVTAPAGAATDAAAAPTDSAAVAADAPADAPALAPSEPATAPPSALLAAFTQLQAVLQPTAAGTTATDPAAALKQFLLALAQGLQGPVPEGDTLRSGSLVNLSA